MSPKRRIPVWLIALVLAPGLLLTAVAGLWVFMWATATPVHPAADAVPSVAASPASPRWADAMAEGRRAIRAHLAEKNIPGLSVAVGVGDAIVWAEGFGWASTEDQLRVSPATRFRFGNGSVVLTSAAAGLLIEQGRLRLDDEIQAYVPEYPRRPWPVTVRHLMGHVAGIGTDDGDEGPFGEHCERPVEGLKLFKDKDLLFEPGSALRFSSFGWILLSAAIEKAAGESFYTFMRRQVFDPLDMTDTRPDDATDPIPNRATFYFPRFAADNRYGLEDAQNPDYSCYAGAFAFLSTPSDLVRFGLAVNTGRLLRPDTITELRTPQTLRDGTKTGYGLGWDLEDVSLAGAPAKTFGHDGFVIGGMAASLVTIPDRGIVVAVMTNTSYVDTFSLALRVAEPFAGKPPRP